MHDLGGWWHLQACSQIYWTEGSQEGEEAIPTYELFGYFRDVQSVPSLSTLLDLMPM